MESLPLASITAKIDIPLTDTQMDAIAERAARRALEMVYAEIGQSVMKKVAWIIGIVILGAMLWLAGKNSLPYRSP